jgi:hypothetical protein
MNTKRELVQERMALAVLGQPGQYEGRHVECVYCTADAVWFHWASKAAPPNRDAFACDEHVRWLDPSMGEAVGR